jgi:predicted esterase
MPSLRSAYTISLALAVLVACKREGGGCGRSPPAPVLPPLAAASPSTSLPLTGFGASVVSVPAGVTRPVPVVVAVLGIGDSPEEQCSTWRDIVGARAFVLCPRGSPNMVADELPDAGVTPTHPFEEGEKPEGEAAPEAAAEVAVVHREAARTHQVGFYPVDAASVEREINAGLAALKVRYGKYVADRDLVYAGFSRGAFLGATVVSKRPDRFRRLVLIEGGQSPWQPASAATFARATSSARVLFACGQSKCVEEAEPAATLLRAQKIDVRVVHGAGEGHGYRRQVKEELRRSFDWLTEGDELWRLD